ncbi:MAG: PEGA domain-containing protein [Deltaproteobacteria bacterium]
MDDPRPPLLGAVSLVTAFAVAVASLGGAGVAWASPEPAGDEGGPRLALLPLVPILKGAPEQTAAELGTELSREVVKGGRFTVVPLAAAAMPNGAGGDAESAPTFHGEGDRSVARGQGLLSRAARAMRRLRFDEAAREFTEALDALAGSFDRLETLDVLRDAELQLAIAELRLGRQGEATKALEDVVRLDPERELARGAYPAVFVRQYAQLRARLLGQPKGTLRVGSTPPGAAVILDGRSVGVTPLELDVVAGRHFVFVRSPGGQIAYRVEVPAGMVVRAGEGGRQPVVRVAAAAGSLPAAAKAVLEEIRSNLLDGPGDEELGKLARSSSADYLLLGGIHTVDSVVTVDALLFSAATDQLVPLKRRRLGAEPGLRALAAEAATRAEQRSFSDAISLPGPIAADFDGLVAAAPKAVPAPPPVLASGERPATKRATAAAKPGGSEASDQAEEDEDVAEAGRIAVPAPKAKRVNPHAIEADSESLGTPEKDEAVVSRESSTSSWTTVGLIALTVAAVGAGAYFGGTALFSKPSAGAPVVSW